MKQFFYSIIALLFVTACSSDDSDGRNPYLGEPRFSYDINLNLPQYASLGTPGNAVYIANSNVGIRGVIVFNQGFGNYFAWEASCPNHAPSSCSTMTIQDGVTCVCSCEDYKYSLANGSLLTDVEEGVRPYGLLNYRVTVNNNMIQVYN
ncbi:hypothetical protein OOZ15_13785 [Galbibacter sp. EGI 63066]|uniref:Rieske (2Fe-2S) protein n=1 Tax=Galbibacter sp. EGI 63066 TaxID=2993559 RepID=UPI002248A4E8|nr:hypothetical protein [Galbibacter sp. EGI 63066]MCX2681019.1 hypothetical protein [Galbibacter sp. EGI 63066]